MGSEMCIRDSDDASCPWVDIAKVWYFLNMLDMIINLGKNLKLPFDFDYLIFSELVSIYFQKK